MNKRAFTLVEMMISITIFSIVIIFLYQALDITKKSNKFYTKQLEKLESKSDIKKLIFEDIINSEGNTTKGISEDKNGNQIFKFKTSNIFHNPFYTNVTYLLSKEDNLLRIESKDIFDKNKMHSFIDNTYIDIVENNVTKFKISKNKKDKKSYAVYIEYQEKDSIIFTLKSIR